MTFVQRAIGYRWAPLVMFLLWLPVLLTLMDLRLNVYDEAIILTGAQQVIAGSVPHRDFYANYGPGQFYLVAAIFKLFGPSFLAARVYDALLRAAIVSAAFALLAPRARPQWVLAGTAVCGLWMLGAGGYLYATFPTLLLALAGTYLLVPIGGRGIVPGRAFAAGLLTGLTALFRYDVGFYLLMAHLVALAILAAAEEGSARHRFLPLIRRLLLYGLGVAATFLPPAALLLAQGAAPGFLHDIVAYPLAYYQEMRGLPFPGPREIVRAPYASAVYLPFAIPLLAVALYAARRRDWAKAFPAEADRSLLWLLISLTLFMTVKGLVRVENIHMLLAIVPATLLLALLLDRVSNWPLAAKAAAAALALVAASVPLLQSARLGWAVLRQPALSLAGSVAGLERPGGMTVAARSAPLAPAQVDRDTACASDFLSRHWREGDRLFSGTGRHDKLFANNLAVYFGTKMQPGTHWYQLDPGLQTRADVQAEMIGDLEASKARWLVRDSRWDDVREPNDSAKSGGVYLLDGYLRARYEPVHRCGLISIWTRSTSPGPGSEGRSR